MSLYDRAKFVQVFLCVQEHEYQEEGIAMEYEC